MAEFFIIGTSHTLQCGHTSCAPASIAAFRDELVRVCKKESIQRVADEMSTDGLRRHQVSMTVGANVAAELGIQYQHVDLTSVERNKLSIDDTSVFPTIKYFQPSDGGTGIREALGDLADAVRERIWIARLLSKAHWPTLFICGADHVQSVRRIVRSLGLDSKVVHRCYGT